MRTVLFILLAAAALPAQTKIKLDKQTADLPVGIAARVPVFTMSGAFYMANLDSTSLELNVTGAGVATLRAKVPPTQTAPPAQTAFIEKATKVSPALGVWTLQETPLTNTVPKVYRNGLLQDPTSDGDYSMTGAIITPSPAAGWTAADTIVVIYFGSLPTFTANP